MVDVENPETIFSVPDEDERFEAIEFDPECTFVDEEIDSDTLAFRDAVRDIWACEGQFALIVP